MQQVGFIDKLGEIIIPFIYDDADSFEFGKARVILNNREFYIDMLGNEV
jgi:hypothetical protein